MRSKELVLKIKSQYGALRDIHIVKSSYDYSDLRLSLGKKAAEVYESVVTAYSNPKVGIGGGHTIYQMIKMLKPRDRKIRIYPTAIIGRGPEINFFDSAFLVKLLLQKSRPSAKAFAIGIPPFPNDVESARQFKQRLLDNIPEVSWLNIAMQDVDIAFVGLGSSAPTGDFDGEMIKLGFPIHQLSEHNIIGGINYNWFDDHGKQYFDYFLTISIEQLQLISADPQRVIALVAGGTHKLPSIKTAVSNGMINCLITDLDTAHQLVGGYE